MMLYNEKISQAFDWYLRNVLPVVSQKAIQQKYGYHGIYTHTSAVVFRGIDYALSLDENPKPVVLACAFHDMARTNDGPDAEHGANAVPIIKNILYDSIPVPPQYMKPIIYAVKNHTIGMSAPDYISACLWDADRTRLSWDMGFNQKFFSTDRAKQIASGDCGKYLNFMRDCMSEYARNIIVQLDKQY